MISGLTALGAEDSHGHRAKWSYLLLADELRRRSARSNQDLEKLFRRMVFNVAESLQIHPNRSHCSAGFVWGQSWGSATPMRTKFHWNQPPGADLALQVRNIE